MSHPYSIVFIIFVSTRRRCPFARTVSAKPPIFCIRFSHFSVCILPGDGFAGIDPVRVHIHRRREVVNPRLKTLAADFAM
jgi:hypothetical protein